MASPNAPSGIAEVNKLAELIVASVKDVVSEYQGANSDIPSLLSTESGPFDAPHLQSAKLAKALLVIEAACAQLTYTVTAPGHVIANKAYGFEEPIALQVVGSAKVADHLLGKPDGLHVEELGKLTQIDAKKLGRLLRLLATKHCFQEVKPNIFANNKISLQLVSTNPVSGLVGHVTGEVMVGSVRLNETLSDPKVGSSTSVDDTPFVLAHGTSTFGYYDTPEGSKLRDRFAQAMVGWGEVTGRAMLPKSYAWDQVPRDSVVCDIGGGNGHASLGLIKAYPHLKVVLQDLPATVDQGREYWRVENPEAVQNKRVEFVPLDFFTQNPVTYGDYYYIRHVLHDWPTSDCIKILTGIRKSMGPSSRLLIHELVLQHAVRDSAIPNQAPEPLLANYGVARVRPYNQDLNMLATCNSQERTLQEFIDMGEKTGFKFVKLWDAGEAGLVEFRVV
ncbi:hypothetical protein HYPSUDRAFT_33246 [Hypholoma sublateritium FD-334 SS-4]|uniref:O-methyltransferase C-terminal domain-containing protein n=1 Tax=Hypholoma sublateritium (strain FD-334 SS-4) TaxID=945553 RepID=A0A0D2PKC5_HYPSF|nr:hypothetical protein HYPSUDRAFT_33246 [Hypholoma sublateritium FD-334 SS-4]